MMKRNEFYMVGALKESMEMEIFGQLHIVPMDWADGMVGACPVFNNKESAEKYADGRYGVEMVKLSKKGEQNERAR